MYVLISWLVPRQNYFHDIANSIIIIVHLPGPSMHFYFLDFPGALNMTGSLEEVPEKFRTDSAKIRTSRSRVMQVG